MRSAITSYATKYRRRVIRRFLADAYYSHEITPGDYFFLLDKADRS